MWPFKNGIGILSVILSKTNYQQKTISKQKGYGTLNFIRTGLVNKPNHDE